MLTLSEIWIYPVKSLAGIRLKRARVIPKGLQYDRRWMLVDEKNIFISQRTMPELTRFTLSLSNTVLTVVNKMNSASLILDVTGSDAGVPSQVAIWDDEVQAVEVNPAFSKWFSDQLKITCRLVFFPEPNVRDVDPNYVKNREQVGLADGYPFLMIGQSSLDDLNNRLETPLEMRRFRPNFVFTGGRPYEEEQWRQVRIGNNLFLGVKPCARCVLTTVNPDSGEKGREPLLTLSKYRKEGNKILFGQNLIGVEHNEINEGDEITVESSE